MPTLMPFRDYSEKDVINLYAFSGNIPVQKGTIMTIAGDGFRNDVENTESLGNFGGWAPNNWVGNRYGTLPKVITATPTDTTPPLGISLFDVRELDENQLPLKYNPRKAAEMEAVISGQTLPIVTKGIFLYSGINLSGGVLPKAGAPVYVGYSGEVATSGALPSLSDLLAFTGGGVTASLGSASPKIGRFLGVTGSAAQSGTPYGNYSRIALVWFDFGIW